MTDGGGNPDNPVGINPSTGFLNPNDKKVANPPAIVADAPSAVTESIADLQKQSDKTTTAVKEGLAYNPITGEWASPADISSTTGTAGVGGDVPGGGGGTGGQEGDGGNSDKYRPDPNKDKNEGEVKPNKEKYGPFGPHGKKNKKELPVPPPQPKPKDKPEDKPKEKPGPEIKPKREDLPGSEIEEKPKPEVEPVSDIQPELVAQVAGIRFDTPPVVFNQVPTETVKLPPERVANTEGLPGLPRTKQPVPGSVPPGSPFSPNIQAKAGSDNYRK